MIGTFERTINKFLQSADVTVPYCYWDGQKLLTGVASKHLTRSGVKYNRLLRIVKRTRREASKD